MPDSHHQPFAARTTFTKQLDAIIENRALLNHSFYVRWQQGTVTWPELQGYAKEYYAFEREFPRFVSGVHARCDNATVRQHLLKNLVDEEQGEKNHRSLWLQFAAGLGVAADDVEAHLHNDQTEFLLRTFRTHTTNASPVQGLAALYAYERQQPKVAGSKIQGLQWHYGVSDESTLEFFRVHQTADEWHSETEGQALEQLCADESSKQQARQVVQETCDALYEFLDGVERQYGPCH